MSDKNQTDKALIEEKWLALREEAEKWRGVSSPGNAIVPEWYDHARFKRSQRYLRKNYPRQVYTIRRLTTVVNI